MTTTNQTDSLTYTLRACFQAEDGRRTWKTIDTGLSWDEAMDRKEQLLERVSHCVSAVMTPERKR